MIIELPDYYEEWYPEHSRSSCSDEHPINAAVDGTGCHRCNAIRFAEHEQLRTEVAALEAENAKLKAECQKQRDELLAVLEKCKDPSIHAHIVAEKAIAKIRTALGETE